MTAVDMQKVRDACAIAGHVRGLVASLIQPGARLIDVALAGHERIAEMGGRAAFPLQISRNEIAAHYCPYIGDPTEFEEGDVVKADIGVHVDGHMADTAVTVDLSADGRHENLLLAAKEALDAAISVAGPEVEVAEVGRAIHQAITARGLNPIRNLTGHGVDRWCIHKAPQIPNVPSGRGRLKANTFVAIEPFATDGEGMIEERGDAHVFMAKKSGKKARGAHPKVLAAISEFRGLPFGSRDLVQLFPLQQVADTLNAMNMAHQLISFPPLCEKKGRLVSQFEHTLHITDSGAEVLTAAARPWPDPAGTVTTD
ncbi:MAG: type II methionyl aminopeptidase [Planctomycetota bacterium]